MATQLEDTRKGQIGNVQARLRKAVSITAIPLAVFLGYSTPANGQSTATMDTEQAAAIGQDIDPEQLGELLGAIGAEQMEGSMEAIDVAQAAESGKAMDSEQAQLMERVNPEQAAPDLFAPVAAERMEFTTTQDTAMDRIRQNPTTKDVRLVRINVGLLREGAVSLNAFADRTFTAKNRRTDVISDEAFTWFGDITDPAGSAILAVRGDNVTGSIRAGNELYSVRPIGGGVHAIIRVDETKFPPEHPPEFDQIKERSGSLEDPTYRSGADTGDLGDQIRVLNVLVAFTPAVNAAVADIDGLIQLAIAETNQSYMNSEINLTAKLAHSYEVSYTESGSFSTDLARFRGTTDGNMDEVHTVRHHHGADVAILLINDTDYCGLASGIGANAATAFAVVYHGCATGYFSFAHEIGHLQSARHNPQADSSTTPFAYGHGYYYEPDNWRTVMSYRCPAGCTRLPYWSNPNVQYGGVAMGTAATNNNARVLNQTAATVTAFKAVPEVGGVGYAWAHSPTANNYTPSATYSHNSSGGPIQISRNGTGRYRVRFGGLGGNGTAGGHVQVTAYGGGSRSCKVRYWSSSGPDFIANVRCYSSWGSLSDARYTVLVMWP